MANGEVRPLSPADQVIRALRHEPVRPLPRGELFVGSNLLDRLFPEAEGNLPRQLERLVSTFELSLIGVDLENERIRSLASKEAFHGLEGYFLVGTLNGPVSRLIEREGFFKGMVDFGQKGGSFVKVSQRFLHDVRRVVQEVSSHLIRAIAVTDDIAGSQGLFFSPGDFNANLRPLYREAVAIVKEAGLFSFFHSDGDIRKIVDGLIEDGFDCLHPVDAQAGQNLYELAKAFGDRLCFMGHIDIVAWSKAQIEEEVDRAERSFARGGLILGSSCGLSIETLNEGLGGLYPGWKRWARQVTEMAWKRGRS